jgi:polysaccharide deacetylase family protein (PEP-CTERM system associated)
MNHVLTIDFEDWHRLAGMNLGLRVRSQLHAVEAASDRLLELLAEHFVKATFFVLGELAEKLPHLVRRIAVCGHEVASHGHRHYPAPARSADFAADTRRSVAVLSEITGLPVVGYRSPRFALPADLDRFFGTLADAHLTYDASVFPFAGRSYGLPWFPRTPQRLRLADGRPIAELPAAVLARGGAPMPVAGGSNWYTTPPGHVLGWVRCIADEGRPFVAYLHSYDFDPASLRLGVPATDAALAADIARMEATFNTGRDGVPTLLAVLLRTFPFTTAAAWLAEHPNLPELAAADLSPPAATLCTR